jgi:Protein of unknown function (DUF3106)
MMHHIAIGLATATITLGASTLSASSGVSKGSMGWSINGHRSRPRTHGFAELSPHERIHLRATLGERYEQLSPLERERLMGIVRERVAKLAPHERMRLRANAREHVAQLPPHERERHYRHGLYYGRR